MSNVDRDSGLGSDEAVEALLGQALPRPVPPDAEARAVRQAVHAEWKKVSGRRSARRKVVALAMAASVLVAAFLSLNMLQTGGIQETRVASIDKRFGSIYILGENAELVEGNSLTTVTAGQTLITDDDAGIGLGWGGGGSLRVDANTRIEFLSDEEIYLHTGRIYFDSTPALGVASISGSDARLAVLTDFGEVAHVGTQYMARADADQLTVSVREGEVQVISPGGDAHASRNQQLAISGSGAHRMLNIRPDGGNWRWVEETAPSVNLDGRSVNEFLGWVSRETGLSLSYESAGARSYAEREILNGTLETGPRQALEIWMLGTDLEWRIGDDGVIYVQEVR
jgi:hypothetical protein